MKLFLVKLYNLLSPTKALAQDLGSGEGNPASPGPVVENIPIVFENPLGGNGLVGEIDSIKDLIAAILKIILTVGIPLIVLAIIYTGFMFVAARGDKSKIEDARRAFTWTIVGAIVLLASFVIAEAIDGTIQQIINS